MVGKNPDKSDYICSLIFGHLDDGTPLVINLITTPHLLVVGGNGNGRHKILSQLTDVHWPREKVIIECPIEEEGMFARLEWLSEELERRYRLIADAGLVRIGDYNISHPYDCQPYIVFVVSLLDSIKDQPRFEAYVRRIAAKAKSVGIHFIFFCESIFNCTDMAEVFDNIPSVLCFHVEKERESEILLESTAASSLSSEDEALYMRNIESGVVHVLFEP